MSLKKITSLKKTTTKRAPSTMYDDVKINHDNLIRMLLVFLISSDLVSNFLFPFGVVSVLILSLKSLIIWECSLIRCFFQGQVGFMSKFVLYLCLLIKFITYQSIFYHEKWNFIHKNIVLIN